MDTDSNGKYVALLCLFACAIGWGSIPVFLKHFTTHLDAWTVNGVRYSVGALFWLPFVVALSRRGKPRGPAAPGRSVWRDALLPTSVNIVGQTGYALSPYYLEDASTIAFTLRLSFLFTMAFGFVFLAEERLLVRRPVFWAGAGASVAGAALMFFSEARKGGAATVLGILIVAGSTIAWGAYAVSVRKRMAGYPIRLSFGVISLYTAAALVVLMLLFGRVGDLGHVTGGLWVSLVGSALIGIALGHVLYYRGIHRLGPVVSSGVLLLTPFVTYLIAAVALEETMGGLQLAGGLAVILGGALLVRARAQAERRGDASPGLRP